MENTPAADWTQLPVFRREDLMESCMDDMALVKDIVHTVLEDVPNNLALLDQALASGDLETARRGAHSVKSVARQLGGTRLATIMLAPELALKDGHRPDPAAMAAAAAAWQDFRAALIDAADLRN